jgi:hypothetical protein
VLQPLQWYCDVISKEPNTASGLLSEPPQNGQVTLAGSFAVYGDSSGAMASA